MADNRSEFTSPDPSPLQLEDLRQAARRLGCDVPAIRAVVEVESLGGGYQRDGRPKVLFERHCFHRETKGRWSALYPDISSPQAGGYRGGAAEYERLARAMELDRTAALRSASWGAYQIMGFNHALVGFDTVGGFVEAMVESSARQLAAFIAFIETSGLAEALRTHDWAGFARGYNGPAFRRNRYDEKLARAYRRFAATDGDLGPVLRRGMRGEAVADLQKRLRILADGIFGPMTQHAVREFQRQSALDPDGIVGRRTWSALPRR